MSRAFLKIAGIMCAVAISGAVAQSAQAAHYYDQSLLGVKLRLPVHKWITPEREQKGIIVANQGLVFSGRAYDSIARHLANQGYCVYAPDFRGFGDWVTKYQDFDGDPAVHFTQTKEDLTRLLKQLRHDFPDKPIFLLGESFGANYSIWEASTEPHLMDGVIATSTCFQMRVHPRARWFLTFAQGLSHPKKPLDVAPYLKPILSDDDRLTEACLADPTVCTKLSATDLVKAMLTNRYSLEQLEKIPPDLPVLLIAGKRDQVQNSQKIQAALQRIGSKDVDVVVLPDRGHLLLEHQPVDPKLAQALNNWLTKHTPVKATPTAATPAAANPAAATPAAATPAAATPAAATPAAATPAAATPAAATPAAATPAAATPAAATPAAATPAAATPAATPPVSDAGTTGALQTAQSNANQ